jgi:hypothetical protein
VRATSDVLDEIRGIIAAHARPDMTTPIAGLLLAKVDTETPEDDSLTEPLLVVMAQGGKRILLGDRVFEYRAGQCLVVTANLPITGRGPRGEAALDVTGSPSILDRARPASGGHKD